MKSVFISGSIKIKSLAREALNKIDSIIAKNFTIIVGDAKGVDLQVQKYLLKKDYRNVRVYYAGNTIRNNIGNWETKNIISQNKEKGRALYTLKDISMAHDADYGLMVWDGESQGTLNNISEMQKRHKRFYVVMDSLIVNEKQIDDIIGMNRVNKEKQLVLF